METQESLATMHHVDAINTSEATQPSYDFTQTDPLESDQSLSAESVIVGFTWVILMGISLIFWGSVVYAVVQLFSV